MNELALRRTHESGELHLWSRSRGELWHKGATSGNTQAVRALRLDCDGDAVLALVEPAGPACHTGERTCFHRGDTEATAPHEALPALERTLAQRAAERPEGSYIVKLLDDAALRGEKVQEEAEEVVRAAREETDDRVDEEAADLLFHLTVLLHARERTLADAWRCSWPSPLSGPPQIAPSLDEVARSRATPLPTPSSPTARRRSPRSSSCAATARRSCSSPPSRASASGAGRSSACARARCCAGRSAIPATRTRWRPRRSARTRLAPQPGLPPFAGGAVGYFGYDLVRTVEPLGPPNPDPVGLPDMALMLTDALVAFDHLKHTITVVAMAGPRRDRRGARGARPGPCSRRRARSPAPWRRPNGRPTCRASASRRTSRGSSSTSMRATPSRSCRRSAGARPSRRSRSRSTAACARSTRRRTCTSWTSSTSRSSAPRPSRC